MENILLVCTGNTCRSAMAEALFKDAIEKNSILKNNVQVDSAGTFACEGQEATDKALIALSDYGLDISKHRAKQVDLGLVEWADIILTMEAGHIEQIKAMFPNAENKLNTIIGFATGVYGYPGDNGYDVPDPYGESLEEYRVCADKLKELIDKIVERLEKTL